MYRALRPGILLLLGLLSLVPGRATGQMTGNVDKLKADLHGVNLDAAVAAASALGSLKSGESLEALMGALQLGAPPKLTQALLEALGLQQDARSLPLLRHYASYREPTVRMAAVNAMRNITDKQVAPILVNALGDSSPMVRARAARLLGERLERAAEQPLFRLLRRGDQSAARPLGELGGVETAKHLAELIGVLPNASVATALGTIVKRKDFGPDPLRVEVIRAIDKIPGEDGSAALVEYIASVPEQEIRISKRLAEQYLEQRQK